MEILRKEKRAVLPERGKSLGGKLQTVNIPIHKQEKCLEEGKYTAAATIQ